MQLSHLSPENHSRFFWAVVIMVLSLTFWTVPKLREKGINTRGVIKYKENNRLEEVELTAENEVALMESLQKAVMICELSQPPPIKKNKYCRKCSYFDLCFS
jgi:CRISPR/Cas system-associated exonuclease Cas4 (RecB family)